MSIFNEIDVLLEESSLLTETSNEEVIQKFIYDEFARTREDFPKPDKWSKIWGSANVKINIVGGDKDGNDAKGISLNLYATPILFKDNDGGVYYNKSTKATTFTKLYSTIDGLLNNPPVDELNKTKWEDFKNSIREVDEDDMEKLIAGEKVDLDADVETEPEPEPEVTPDETGADVTSGETNDLDGVAGQEQTPDETSGETDDLEGIEDIEKKKK